jgi:hypothetical protein
MRIGAVLMDDLVEAKALWQVNLTLREILARNHQHFPSI